MKFCDLPKLYLCVFICIYVSSVYISMCKNTVFFCLTRVSLWHWLAQNMVHALWMQSGMQQLWNRRFLSWMSLVLKNPSWIVTSMGSFCPPIIACHFTRLRQMNGKICKRRNSVRRSCSQILSETQSNEVEIQCDTPLSKHRPLFLH